MSETYINEPITSGKVLFETTLGEIDIELWCKECPVTCRNFIQLCMEGYYEGTIFHRVIRDFIIQGGDPTGTGSGGESIYGKSFDNEIHPRLKFRYRGLVGMANQDTGSKPVNNSQFFITLSKLHQLDNKYTLFGKVVGKTIYNVIEMGGVDVDSSDCPILPIKIIKSYVLINPFDNIIPRNLQNKKKDENGKDGIKVSKNQNSKNSNIIVENLQLLSFGDDKFDDNSEENLFHFKKATSDDSGQLNISNTEGSLYDTNNSNNSSTFQNDNSLNELHSVQDQGIKLKERIRLFKRNRNLSEAHEDIYDGVIRKKRSSSLVHREIDVLKKLEKFRSRLSNLSIDNSWFNKDGLNFGIDSNRAYDIYEWTNETIKVVDPLKKKIDPNVKRAKFD
ncbi:peptidyl-prolyl cis-trans isomerase, cyclophilin-type family protein [Cryptosporidium muris RN66]|uniref:Peptidyl-prolyl cis-trans isomerase, cyclophilin-type family protein n=1 Tax=Cryptosporidium muris (strain RN66) TaxID=441375 RepID=B6AI19_CRYMR|nr:peptidyl-prolyl cis-trans isomerase, cyclophilin-type family protein [Cryptosporidium muris RN66]EEA07860.1 peptidyl-prolyl cis-trans isomerase, cyclophilin-type family protein [Cryptosporidium muris RN66]|eukprot:XP_002142209.1 peptidyl-prolyl cis-trans isomerase, cyclophilin-type family protein [Cryptosporidium muris RN66]